MVPGVITGIGFGGQAPNGGAIHVIYHSVKIGTVGACGTKILTNIRVQLRDSMPKNLVGGLVI